MGTLDAASLAATSSKGAVKQNPSMSVTPVSTLSDDDMGEVTFNIIAYKYVPKWTSRCSGLQIDVSSHSSDDTAICPFLTTLNQYFRGLILNWAHHIDFTFCEVIFETIEGELPSPLSPPSGCFYHPRCPLATDICATTRPETQKVSDVRAVACHHFTTLMA